MCGVISLRPFNHVALGIHQGNTLYTIRGLRKQGISTVVNVSNHTDWQFRRRRDGMHYREQRMKDNALIPDEHVLIRAAALYAHAMSKLGGVLVHCDFGLNRSGVVVARALMYAGLDAEEAIAAVREARGSWALYNKDFVRWLKAEQ